MNTETIHLIVKVTGEGFYATSPQAPGLAYGRDTLADLRADLDDVLTFHFDRPGSFCVLEHHERQHQVDGEDLAIRIALDERRAAREEVRARLGRALAVPERARSLVGGPTNRVGEVVYVCAVSSDTAGWLASQLDPRGDAVTIAAAIADSFILTVPLTTYRDEYAQLAGVPIDSLSHASETTIGEVLRDTPIVQPVIPQRSLAS